MPPFTHAAAHSAIAAAAVEKTVDSLASTTVNLLSILLTIGAGCLVGIAVAFIGVVATRMLGRARTFYVQAARHCRNATYALCALIGIYVAAHIATTDLSSAWRTGILRLALIGVILCATWFINKLFTAISATIVLQVKAGKDAGRASRVTTQVQILRRVAAVVVTVCGLVGAVMTFPSARFAMGSLLASAGLVSVVAGLAAQSTLGNIFAGLQLAMTDAIRVGDVVDADDLHGQIEEITLTYVVVKIWDERRLILPSSYFTQTPFANWSRRSQQMQGVVTFEVDWRVPLALMRAELARIVTANSAWDGRTCALVITETSATTVTARVTVSAADPDALWTLQCNVREELIGWLQRQAPYALPRTRVEVEQVEVSHDPQPEAVARLAEELVALQTPDAQVTTTQTDLSAADADPIAAARVRATLRGSAALRHRRRGKVKRRRILARQAPPAAKAAGSDATTVISTKEQEAYLATHPAPAAGKTGAPAAPTAKSASTDAAGTSPEAPH